jgi:hypothetical protein
LTNIRVIFTGLIVGLLCFTVHAETEELIAQVYQDDNITIRAGVINLENRIIHFGEVLPLVVRVTYNSTEVQLQEMDAEFFTASWTEELGAYLLDSQSTKLTSASDTIQEQRDVYQFQILACPDGAVLCKGTRLYKIPEFTLQYKIIDEVGNELSAESVQFSPWPTDIMIASAIPLGEEGELNTFPTYFPTGAFPNPLSGVSYRQPSAGMIAGGLFLLLGGIFMSPFSFFKRKGFAVKEKTRWEEVLEQLKSGEIGAEDQFLDALRKCLVWYCVDTLKVDPYYWLKHEEEVSGEVHKSTGEFAEVKSLFIDLLHSPSGEGDVLLERLTGVIADAR